ncbi:MAG: class I SAM-dependent methyltransferase [Planctomycetota bacterium]
MNKSKPLWANKPVGKLKLNSRDLTTESQRLQAAWMKYESQELDSYLVRDVENPRINIQSIISRAFLIDSVFANEFTDLIRQEFRFGICLNFILNVLKTKSSKVKRISILDALIDGQDVCCNIRIPSYLRDCFELLSDEKTDMPDYISQALIDPVSDEHGRLPDSALSTFEQIWQTVLSHKQADSISVLEPACGSANDYRFLHSFGISRFLKYTGFDICEKNITNARSRFPDVHFEVGNALNIPAESDSYDYVVVHDLFEHLSPAGLELAISEICRVTRSQACLCFFNMSDIEDHVVKPDGLYHWNTLSLNKVQGLLSRQACDIDVVHIDSFLKSTSDCTDYYNKEAYTLIVSF